MSKIYYPPDEVSNASTMTDECLVVKSEPELLIIDAENSTCDDDLNFFSILEPEINLQEPQLVNITATTSTTTLAKKASEKSNNVSLSIYTLYEIHLLIFIYLQKLNETMSYDDIMQYEDIKKQIDFTGVKIQSYIVAINLA